eukprot:CAMPEP_0194298126 /NCGR_PEP_ID=MMETSP0169-20130528/59991_1 /TAXON_ID=218684 /ORGANISM="Corethron pennatum, Strain L29A3" /LENGTH=100 /DNA_ID=CAMNT_0039048075 /DNA_START=407 /DNA_END=709 /DNA_ORIENTATION=-
MSAGPYVFEPLDFLGYAVVVGAIVAVGAYVFEPLDFLGYAVVVGAIVTVGAYVFEPFEDFFVFWEKLILLISIDACALPMSTEAKAITKTLDDNMIKSVI